jgi:hypothetical protein
MLSEQRQPDGRHPQLPALIEVEDASTNSAELLQLETAIRWLQQVIGRPKQKEAAGSPDDQAPAG